MDFPQWKTWTRLSWTTPSTSRAPRFPFCAFTPPSWWSAPFNNLQGEGEGEARLRLHVTRKSFNFPHTQLMLPNFSLEMILASSFQGCCRGVILSFLFLMLSVKTFVLSGCSFLIIPRVRWCWRMWVKFHSLGWAFGGPFSLKILIFHVWEIFLDCLSDDSLSFP